VWLPVGEIQHELVREGASLRKELPQSKQLNYLRG